MARVLVVEDEPAIAESVAYALKRDGFAVETAATCAAARGGVTSVDLVLLDLMLPDGSGFELISELRRRRPVTAIIVLSSRDDEADRVAALETGADDYVTKPFSPREIVARVRAVLRRTQLSLNGAPAPTERTAGATSALTIDEATRRVSLGDRTLELTRVEFDLLAALREHPGRVYTRSQLIDLVWGDGYAISDRTIDSHVKALRRKVTDAGGEAGLIETVRGVGYRLQEAPESDEAVEASPASSEPA